jgi:hypothetical protein
MIGELKRYLIVCDVTSVVGNQTYYVDAVNPDEALAKFRRDGGEFYSEELEVQDFDKGYVSDETTLDDFGDSTPSAAGKDAQDARRDRQRELGAAIEYACEALPQFYGIRLELERDAGTAFLSDPDGDSMGHEFNGDTLGEQINNAVNTAIAHAEKAAAIQEGSGKR